MLKISTNESAGNLVTLQLEGQLVGTWIFELNAACDRFLSAGRKITLDLGDVSLIERRGLTLLRGAISNSGGIATLRMALSPK
jgi:hypothetical protein